MYKVFYQQAELRLCEPKDKKEGEILLLENDRLPDWTRLKKGLIKAGLTSAECDSAKLCWRNFKKRFKILRASGGLVVNAKGEYLMIKRLGMWDLPKGKIEKGEDLVDCAIREVEEECSVFDLGITGKITVTYHVMRRNKHKYLKESHWYMMKTSQTEPGIPQTEEDIEKVRWVSREKLPKKLKNCWPSVKEVFLDAGVVTE